MAYPTTTNYEITTLPGAQPVGTNSTTQNHVLGTRCRAIDRGAAQCGEIELIYLKGVASTAAGDLVSYDAKAGLTVRTTDDGAVGPVAVAMSPCVASQYGWYAIFGVVPVTSGTVVTALPAYMNGATAGSVVTAVTTGDIILGTLASGADSAGFAFFQLAYPYLSQLLG